jgi:SET domain-containing protein
MLPKKPFFAVKRSKTGLGLFALQTIPVNKRIIEYQGTILTNEESEEVGGKYLFTLDENRVIEGSSRSNLARYINHSCEPNARERPTRNRIWIWSLREIQAGEEITIDYGEEYFDAYIKQKGCKCETCSSQSQKKKTK